LPRAARQRRSQRDRRHLQRQRDAGGTLFLVKLSFDERFNLVHGLRGVSAIGLNADFAAGPAASIIRPMMLLPFTFRRLFSTKTSQLNWLAVLTNMAAGRAWMPSLLVMSISFLTFDPLSPGFFAALM